MNMKTGRLQKETRRAILAEVERHRKGRAGGNASSDSIPLGDDRAMHMATHHPPDLGVLLKEGAEGVPALAILDIHVPDTGQEWRVVHKDSGRL